mmetsp:Transcript_30152/g.53029  ORF Transcript_30152/g.53029 Transcript_30152/m.53029 type:complete len:542 (-) Transcript_30152:401-2026(-)|eukprot:CAMPEP_0197522308 /NCGR_PEP_ID=MMETSP1318-20131121/7479_1 /TAXON_ID=552666 /ORGANISM="Partenskyella glossopodia, Strain RCC365" /LENGTH=541 /DNA_ID=CAMNT_0043074645 /DNA_START=159 /DNA_END=1784 /DNA_ORIENTATION=-
MASEAKTHDQLLQNSSLNATAGNNKQTHQTLGHSSTHDAKTGLNRTTTTATKTASTDNAVSLATKSSAHDGDSESLLDKNNLGTIVLAGSGFLADAYDLFVVNLVLVLMESQFGKPSSNDEILVKGMALLGAMIGQLFFGTFADVIGRRIIFICTLCMTVVGCILSAVAGPLGSLNAYQTLAICRLVLGIGVGGEYPLSASITSESSSPEFRGKMMAAVFSAQGLGSLMAPILVMITLSAGASDAFTWRFALAFGAVPGLLSFYFRWKMHETESFQNVEEKTQGSHFDTMKSAFSKSFVVMTVLGTSVSWFLLDISFYGNSLFNAQVSSELGMGSSPYDEAQSALIIAAIGYPGYLFSIAFIESVGRKPIQLMGFAMLAVLFSVIAGAFDSLKGAAAPFFIIYGLTFFFSNFGPNATCYIIPGEVFPSEIKATCHGISAASGKLGAFITTFVFVDFKDAEGLRHVFVFCACIGAAGFIVTVFLIPKYEGKTIYKIHQRMSVLPHSKRKDSVDSEMGARESTDKAIKRTVGGEEEAKTAERV